MKKIPKASGVLRGNCCETCCNISQKTPMNGLTKKNSLTRHAFSERLQQLLIIKRIFYEVPVGSLFVLLEVIILIYP